MRNKYFRNLFLILSFLFVILLCNDVKALTIQKDNVEHNVPDLPPISENFDGTNYSIYFFNSAYHLLTYTNYKEGVYVSTNNIDRGTFGITDIDGNDCGSRVKLWEISGDGLSWVLTSWQPPLEGFGYYNGEFSISSFIYSTIDIYQGSSPDINRIKPDKNNIIFPQVTPLILRPVVAKQRGAMSTTLQEILLILPMILVVVVSYIGLRKALTMLSQILNRA